MEINIVDMVEYEEEAKSVEGSNMNGKQATRERIHRAMADARLLANPASWSRVADSNPN